MIDRKTLGESLIGDLVALAGVVGVPVAFDYWLNPEPTGRVFTFIVGMTTGAILYRLTTLVVKIYWRGWGARDD